ncbi:hypothetical protein F4859DRAFT_513478 [Xylaria cf. heliscus]|nr:hypothetical protein F4859DRAFT_513478 [Xylaria cf. heliscus]
MSHYLVRGFPVLFLGLSELCRGRVAEADWLGPVLFCRDTVYFSCCIDIAGLDRGTFPSVSQSARNKPEPVVRRRDHVH